MNAPCLREMEVTPRVGFSAITVRPTLGELALAMSRSYLVAK